MRKFFVVMLAVLMASAIGCAALKKPEPKPETPMRNDVRTPTAPERLTDMPRTDQPITQAGAEDAADDIADQAEDMAEVEGATCVVVGNVALIGLDLDKDLESEQTEAVKERVARMATKDPRIVNAVCEAGPDSAARIKKIRDDMRAGRPISENFDQIAEFFNRLKPTGD